MHHIPRASDVEDLQQTVLAEFLKVVVGSDVRQERPFGCECHLSRLQLTSGATRAFSTQLPVLSDQPFDRRSEVVVRGLELRLHGFRICHVHKPCPVSVECDAEPCDELKIFLERMQWLPNKERKERPNTQPGESDRRD